MKNGKPDQLNQEWILSSGSFLSFEGDVACFWNRRYNLKWNSLFKVKQNFVLHHNNASVLHPRMMLFKNFFEPFSINFSMNEVF